MNPHPPPTPQESANELEIAAKIACDRGDEAFAKKLQDWAAEIRGCEDDK